jgi:glutathione S-transferase
MLTLLGNLESGNVHKVQMILGRLGIPFARVDVAQSRGEPRRPEFLALNPMGKIPVVVLEGGDVLTESGAILYWFGQGTDLWPEDRRAQTEVLRWMFFEQYSHEPALAVLRYLRRFAAPAVPDGERIRELETRSHCALAAMERRLAATPWLAASHRTLADYALYPYTRWADEAGVRLTEYPAIEQWLGRFEAQARFLPLRAEGATKVMAFDEYFAK